MQIVQGIDTLAQYNQSPLYIALGNFDGVHIGHQAIIAATVAKAAAVRLKSAVLIFVPHPLAVLYPERTPELLIAVDDRIQMLGELGVDFVILHPFTPALAQMPPEVFAYGMLKQKLLAAGVVVGFDYSFGHLGAGTPEVLEKLGQQYDFTVDVIEPVMALGEAVGSRAIRQLVQEGRVEDAAVMLGYSYYLRGIVVHGDGRGRILGFPTANVEMPTEIIRPAYGVYFCRVACEQESYWALTNIGKRPTFQKDELSIEVYLLDVEKNLYGKELKVSLLQRMRAEIHFVNIEQLKAQIKLDVLRAKELINAYELAKNE